MDFFNFGCFWIKNHRGTLYKLHKFHSMFLDNQNDNLVIWKGGTSLSELPVMRYDFRFSEPSKPLENSDFLTIFDNVFTSISKVTLDQTF